VNILFFNAQSLHAQLYKSVQYKMEEQEGQHPLTGQCAPPISGSAGLIGDAGL